MASRLDQALDEVIKDRRSERSNTGRRNNNNRNTRDRDEIPRNRRQVDNDGYIRKRLGPSDTIKSFVRTVNVQRNDRGGRNVNSAWAHDMFEDESGSNGGSILSRLGTQRKSGTSSSTSTRGSFIQVENLHYDVTENDLKELFSTVADVIQAKLVFDPSGRSTGVATIKYDSLSDAENAIKKYNNVELDGQPMRIELKEYTPRAPRASTNNRGRFNNNRLDERRSGNRNDRGRGGGGGDRNNRDRNDNRNYNRKNDRSKQSKSAEDLDKEMDNYMKSTNNEDTDMILD